MYEKILFAFFAIVLTFSCSCDDHTTRYTVNKDSAQAVIIQNTEKQRSQCGTKTDVLHHLPKDQGPRTFRKRIFFDKEKKFQLIQQWTNKTLKRKSGHPTLEQIKETKFLFRENIRSKYTKYISICAQEKKDGYQERKISCALKKRKILEH